MALAKPTSVPKTDVHSRVLRFNTRYMASYIPVEARDHLGLSFGDDITYKFAQEVVEYKNGQEVGRNIVISDGPEVQKAPQTTASNKAPWEIPEELETAEPIIIIRRSSSRLVSPVPEIKKEFDF